MLARIELDYRHEVRHADRAVDVVSRVESDRPHERDGGERDPAADGTLAAEGRSVLVAWDRAGRRSRPITDWEREQLGHQS